MSLGGVLALVFDAVYWFKIPGRTLGFLRDPDGGGFLGIAILIGVGVGFAAAGMVFLIELFEHGSGLLGDRIGSVIAPLITVPLGILGAWWLARRFGPEIAGDGVAEVSAALAVRGGYLSSRSIPLKIVATALTLGGGGSAGREGPIVQVGGAIGSSIARHSGMAEDKVKSLLAAGAAAGIGASFDAPIAGMLFALEVILGSFAIKHMSAVVLASIAAAVTLRSLVPDREILGAASYTMGDPRELLLYAGLVVLVVIGAYLFLVLVDRLDGLGARYFHGWRRPVVAGLMVAGMGIWEPRLFGTGLSFLSDLLTIQDIGERFDVELFGVGMLMLLALGKILATSITLSSGGSGGAFLPSLFIGATLGTGYAQLVADHWSISTIRPGAFAVVGMATMFAAVARAPLTAILIVFEVTGASDYGLVLPLMLAATFASFIGDRVHPESVYTMALARKGIQPLRSSEVDVLDLVTVGEVMFQMGVEVAPTTPLSEIEEVMNRSRFHGIPVVDDGRLVGIITITDVLRMRGRGVAEDAMTARPVTVTVETPVSDALARMATLGIGRMPVVATDDPTRVVGMFRREEAVKAYHRALGVDTDRALARERLLQRTDPGTHYFEFRIPPASIADGKAVRDVSWPQGSTIVSIRRGREVIVPQGSTILLRDDEITAFGTTDSRQQTIERLNASADEPTAELILPDFDVPFD